MGSLSGEYGRNRFSGEGRHHSEAILQGNTVVRTECIYLTVLLYMSAGCKKIPARANSLPEFLPAVAYGGNCQWQVLWLEESAVDFPGLITYNKIINCER